MDKHVTERIKEVGLYDELTPLELASIDELHVVYGTQKTIYKINQ